MSESIPTILKLAAAMVLIVALIAGGKWALDMFNDTSGTINPSDAGTFQQSGN